MERTYSKPFHMDADATLSGILHLAQDVAGDHSALLGSGREDLLVKGFFWAVIRHRVQISRLPKEGEAITVTTWPMPTTRSAYPRATEAYDKDGKLLFRAVSLWVLMDTESRAMVLPKRSGVEVAGVTLGEELEFPGSLGPVESDNWVSRTVCKEDLDVNGHVNNCRYLDWVAQLPLDRKGAVEEFTVCYLSEALEGQEITLGWTEKENSVCIEALRKDASQSAGHSRVFAAELRY